MGHFFLKNWYLYGSTFKFRGGTSLPKPNLSTPPGLSHGTGNTQSDCAGSHGLKTSMTSSGDTRFFWGH